MSVDIDILLKSNADKTKLDFEQLDKLIKSMKRTASSIDFSKMKITSVNSFKDFDKVLKNVMKDYSQFKLQLSKSTYGTSGELSKLVNSATVLYRRFSDIKKTGANVFGLDTKLQQLKDGLISIKNESDFYKLREQFTGVSRSLEKVNESAKQTTVTLGQLTSRFKGLVRFRQIGSIFENLGRRIGQLVTQPVTSKLLEAVTPNMDDVISRFDTIKTFAKRVDAMGLGNIDQANKAVNNLDIFARGLKYRLNDLTEQAYDYSVVLRDLDKSVELTKGFSALSYMSNLTKEQQYRSQREIMNIITGAKLTAQSQAAFIRNWKVPLQKLADQSGLTINEYLTKISQGTTEARDSFVNDVIAALEFPEVKKLLKINTETLTSAFANFGTAVIRGYTNTLIRIDSGLQKNNTSLVKVLNSMKSYVERFYTTLGDSIVKIMPQIKEFIAGFKDISLSKISDAVVTTLFQYVKFIGNILKVVAKYPKLTADIYLLNKFVNLRVLFGSVTSVVKDLLANKITLGWLTKLKTTEKATVGAAEVLSDLGTSVSVSISKMKIALTKMATVGGVVVLLAGLGATIKLLVSVVQDIGNLRLDDNFLSNLANVGLVFGSIATVVSGISIGMVVLNKVFSSKSILIGEGLTAGFEGLLLFMTYIADKIVPIVDKISKLNVKGFKNKFDSFKRTLTEITNMVSSMVGVSAGIVGISTIIGGIFGGGAGAAVGGLASAGILGVGELITSAQLENLNSQIDIISKLVNVIERLNKISLPDSSKFNIVKKLVDWIKNFLSNLKDVKIEKALEYKDSVGYLDKSLQSISNIMTNVNKITDSTIEKLKDGTNKFEFGVKQLTSKKDGVFDKITTLLEELREQSTRFVESLNNPTEYTTGDKNKRSTKRNTTYDLSTFKQNIDNLQGVLTSVSGIIELVKNLSQSATKDAAFVSQLNAGSDLYNVIIQIASFTDKIGSAVQQISVFATKLEGIDTEKMRTSANQIKNSIVDLYTALGEITKASDLGAKVMGKEYQSNDGNRYKTRLSQIIDNLLDDLTNSLEKAGDLQSKALSFNLAITTIKNALTGTNGLKGLIENCRKSLVWFSQDISNARLQLQKLREYLTNMPKQWVVDFQMTGIDSALYQIDSVRSAMDNLRDKTINVDAQVSTISRIGDLVQKNALGHYSKGGDVQYKASGGRLFKRKGTDTIPAMLTAGEFVHRKKAVDTYGTRFMERINALDLKGAFMSLSRQNAAVVGNLLGGATVTNNYNKTNNAKLTQNIYGGTMDYSYRRANRYVRSL